MYLHIFEMLISTFLIFLSCYNVNVNGRSITKLKKNNLAVYTSSELQRRTVEAIAHNGSIDVAETAQENCNKGKCTYPTDCNCCPGFNVFEEGFWFREKSCKECKCGKQFNCTFYRNNIKSCLCETGYTEVKKICKADCKKNPCQNDGECLVKGGDIFCMCKEPYTGDLCEKNKCSLIECQNNGTCTVREGKAICNCTKEYTGEYCQIDKCSQIQCQNNGKCIIKYGETSCNCTGEYTGEFCEIDKCSQMQCQNDGKCINKDGETSCNCTEEYTGEFCEIDKCSQMQCQNDGKCIIKDGEKSCNCTEEYTGEFCEIG